jgi:3-phenylpropionate/trans-cinnamate dioxygenase ferredoxin reductase component
MGYRTILVGTDGSATATTARDAAIRLAKRLRAKLIVACAYGPPSITRLAAESLIESSLRAATQSRVEAEAELAQRDPSEFILEVADRRNVDLVVVGNKGMGQARRFKLGSVPDRVAYFAPCDLLIVDTTKFPERTRERSMYRRILAGTDGSPTASEAARKAFELAMLVKADVTLAYIGDPIVGAITLEQTAASKPEGVHVDPWITQGDPAEKIVEIAESGEVDLVVVGNKGMAGARRFLLGSVPNKVAHYTPTDVLIVKTVERTIDDIAPGHGAVVDVDNRRLAVFRDDRGRLLALSPKCTHMGCTVDWNDAEQTWDCPCHGSRFGTDGGVLRGPAAKPLPREYVGKGLDAEPDTGAGATGSRSEERIVIVGGGLSGGSAAAALRREGFDGSLTLIAAEPHPPYERPPLSKSFLRGETPFEEALVEPEEFWAHQGVDLRTGQVAASVDPGTKTVRLASGDDVPYDKLLVTTGARNRRFSIPGLALEGIHFLRTVDEARRIRDEIAPGRRVVIGGMGFIGSEVAASLRQRGVEVTVVDGGSVPLQRVLGEQVGAVLGEVHRDQGVRIVPNDRVASFEGTGRVESVVTANGERLPCDFVVLGLGVEPVTELLAETGAEIDNGIVVDELCRTNLDAVFAAGDVANHFHPVYGLRVRVEHWQHAIKHGQAAARSMLGKGEPYRDVHWFWSDQYDTNLQYAGYHREWDDLVIRGDLGRRSFTGFYLKRGIVQAVVAVNRGEDVRAATPLIEARATADRSSLADDRVALTVLSGAEATAGQR